MNKREMKAAFTSRINCLENNINHLKDQVRRMCTHPEGEVLIKHVGFMSYNVLHPAYYTKECHICGSSILITADEYLKFKLAKCEKALKKYKERIKS